MKIYIRKNIKGYYVDFPEEIDAEYWEGQIGETYEDFLDNKWILLNDEQVQFHEDNPDASVKEVIEMQLTPVPEPSIENQIIRARQEKLAKLHQYDNSSEVNEFSINGELKTWFTPSERSNYKNSIDSAKLLGISNLTLLVNGTVIELPTSKAEQLLAMIQLYADACYMVTKQHEGAIQALQNIVEIEEYDYTAGYPKKLNFEL